MFLFQQGYGMLTPMLNFLRQHTDSGIILSPRVSERDQMERYIPRFSSIPGQELFFDPFFYEPRTNLWRVLTYPYFTSYDFQTSSFEPQEFCEYVISYQIDSLELSSIVLPGRYTNSLNDSWLEMHYNFAQTGAASAISNIYSTIALGPDIILNPDNFDTIIDEVVNYPVNGVYLVFEHPDSEYLLNEEFIYVILDAILSIVLSGKRVIVGYSHQQSLVFAAAGADHIASGNYRNVRAFDHLNTNDRDEEIIRRGVWYFDGNTFGEFKIPNLALAFRRNLNQHFGPATIHTRDLLSSATPSSVVWRETDAFNHYFELMYQYCSEIYRLPKNIRAQHLVNFFQTRRDNNENLMEAGFNFGERGFNNAIYSTLSALNSFIADRRGDLQHI